MTEAKQKLDALRAQRKLLDKEILDTEEIVRKENMKTAALRKLKRAKLTKEELELLNETSN